MRIPFPERIAKWNSKTVKKDKATELLTVFLSDSDQTIFSAQHNIKWARKMPIMWNHSTDI